MAIERPFALSARGVATFNTDAAGNPVSANVIRFVGGTGRFAGAHGTGNGVVVVNLLTGAFEITMIGDINY